MPTTAIQRLREDVGFDKDDTTSFSDPDAQDVLDEAAEEYSGKAANAYARVLKLRRLLAPKAEETDYVQNESQEKAGQKFAHWQRLLEFWEKQLAAAGGGLPAVFKVY